MGLARPNQDQIWTDSNINTAYGKVCKMVAALKNVIGYGIVDAISEEHLQRKIIVTDNWINKEHIQLWPEFYGNYLYTPSYELRNPAYLFNCFMSRTDPFRQSWLYQFQRNALIDRGLITFNLDYRDDDLQHLRGNVELFDEMFNKGNFIFEKEHKLLREKVPFCNFKTSLEQAIIDSKVSVVLETYFDRREVIAFSEKVFRALQLPRPILLFSAPGAIQHLKNCGFDLLDDLVDHGYDLEETDVVRQRMILDQLDIIDKLQYTNSSIIDRMQKAKEHNQDRLSILLQQWPGHFKKIYTQLQNYK
tara:strand:+ start:744 stop:1658 length:915 start_codon:yes stop_codon:yes gene_type:complete